MRQGSCTQRLEVSCGDTWCVKYSEEVKPEDHPFLLETQPSLAWPILGRKLPSVWEQWPCTLPFWSYDLAGEVELSHGVRAGGGYSDRCTQYKAPQVQGLE